MDIFNGMSEMSVNTAAGTLHMVHRFPLPLQAPVLDGLAFSPDGRILVMSSEAGMRVLRMNRRTGVLRKEQLSPQFAALVPIFSPRGNLLAIQSNRRVVTVSVDRRTGSLTTLSQWDSRSEMTSDPGNIAFNPQGNLLAMTTDFGVTVLSVGRRGKLTLRTHVLFGPSSSGPGGLAFSPNGRFLAMTDFDADKATMLRVDKRTGRLRRVAGRRLKTGVHPTQLAFSPDGKLLAIVNSDGGTLTVASVNERSGRLRQVPHSPFRALPDDFGYSTAFDPRGGLLAFGDSAGRIALFSTVCRDAGNDPDCSSAPGVHWLANQLGFTGPPVAGWATTTRRD